MEDKESDFKKNEEIESNSIEDKESDFKKNEDTISSLHNSIQFSPSHHPDQPTGNNGLGRSFQCPNKYSIGLAGNKDAMYNSQNAVQLAPKGNDDAAFKAAPDSQGYSGTRDLAVIENGIINVQRVITQLPPENHAMLPSFLYRLGTLFQSRFLFGGDSAGDLVDSESAISNFQKAIGLIPEDDKRLTEWVYELGISFESRFIRTGNLEDSDRAISNLQRTILLTPEDSYHLGGLCNHLFYLARSYCSRYKVTQNPQDLAEAISAYHSSAIQGDGRPMGRYIAAREWASLCHLNGHPDVLQAYGLAIELIPQITDLSQSIYQRTMHLSGTSELLSSATAAAINLGEIVTAMNWLEQGRCFVWSQINQLRSPAIEKLRVDHPSLVEHIDGILKVAQDLLAVGTSRVVPEGTSRGINRVKFSPDMMVPLDEVQRVRGLKADWASILIRLRELPGLHNFLQPLTASDLLAGLPENGSIITFSIHKDRCDIIALKYGEDKPLHIPLRDFTHQKAVKLWHNLRTYLNKIGARMREADSRAGRAFPRVEKKEVVICHVLRELWECVVKPSLEGLGYSLVSPPEKSRRPRVWWCPTGPLSFLPLHAAGIYDAEKPCAGLCISDFVISSYTPTAGALIDKLKVDRIPTISKILLISQPFTPGLQPIPATQRETQRLKDKIEGEQGIETLLLEGAAANIASVAGAMHTYNWVHFACHAVQDKEDPLKSGICLHDGRLDLLEMVNQQIPNTEHAFLSACQTSTGDEIMSDEAMHIAAGVFSVGYRGVVATMWGIKDQYGPEVAEGFYENLLKWEISEEAKGGRLESAGGACALDETIRGIRETLGDSEQALLTWVPYVHFGV